MVVLSIIITTITPTLKYMRPKNLFSSLVLYFKPLCAVERWLTDYWYRETDFYSSMLTAETSVRNQTNGMCTKQLGRNVEIGTTSVRRNNKHLAMAIYYLLFILATSNVRRSLNAKCMGIWRLLVGNKTYLIL